MPYIGNQPAEQFTSFATQEFSTSATTSYTLDHAVTNENEIALFINNVRQQPGSGKAYTATGTALTLSAATASTDTMYCVFLGRALQTVTPATNSISTAMISDNAVSAAKISASLGKVLQVVTATDSTGRTTTSTSFVTGSNTMSVDITPSSTSNKIFVMATGNIYNNTASKYTFATIKRDSTDLGSGSDKGLTNMYSGGGGDDGVPLAISVLDSPSSTSQLTYQVFFRVSGGTGALNESDAKGSITAFEIAG